MNLHKNKYVMKSSILRAILICTLMCACSLVHYAHAQEPGNTVSSDEYTWRLDEIRTINLNEYDADLGDTVKSGSLTRFYYDSTSFYTLNLSAVDEWLDSVGVFGAVTRTMYSHLGPNGKHKEEKATLQRPMAVMSADSFATYNPFLLTTVRNTYSYDYQYDTYRNVYSDKGELIRQIRNYDVTEYELDFDSLIIVLWDTTQHWTDDEILALYNRLPSYITSRRIVTQTDTTSSEITLIPYDDYKADSFYVYEVKKERYQQHRCVYSETKLYTYYKGKTISTTFNAYNLSGATIASGTITEKWDADSLRTSYILSRQEFDLGKETRNLYDLRTFANGVMTKKSVTDIVYGQDSIWDVRDSYTYTYDSLGVDSAITRTERVYDRQSQKDLYLAQSTFSNGAWRLNSLQAWQLFPQPQGAITKLTRDYAYHCMLYHPRYSSYLDKDLTFAYDQNGQLTFAQDSSSFLQSRYIKDSLGVYSLLKRDTIYVYTIRELTNGKLTHGKNYRYHFLDDWTLTNDTVVTEDYTRITVINTADTTRTTSTTYARPFGGSNSVKEKRNAQSGEWELVSENNYTVITNQNGVPQSATSSTVNANGETTDADYYIFQPWDNDKQCYTRNQIGWAYWSQNSGGLQTHFYDSESYTYYNRKGEVTGFFHNTCSSCELTDTNIYGIYKTEHLDESGRIDTVRWFAFYGEWYPIRYDVYSYVPEGDGTDVAAIAHYTVDPSSYWYESDYKVDDEWCAGWWRRLLSGNLMPGQQPLVDMHYFGTDNRTHTYNTYNDAGWVIEIRQYTGDAGPVVRHPNVFTYDEQGRVTEHITYTDTLPTGRKVYFYDDAMTDEAVACVTWSNYDTATATWEIFSTTIYGASQYDEAGRLTTSVKYIIISGDEMTLQPTERYEYQYEGDNRDWLLRDYYRWSNEQWICQKPTYRGSDLNPVEIDAKGNLSSRSTGAIGCGGVPQPQYSWRFDYDTSLGGSQPILSPTAYGVEESTIFGLFNGHHNTSRPISGTYQRGTSQESDILFRYTQLKDLPADTLPEEIIPSDTIATDTIPQEPQEQIGYVTVEPAETTAYFTWPTDEAAEKYIIDIRKDGEIFCHLTLDAIGRLISIAFTPDRDGSQSVEETMRFLVTGLARATKYNYTVATLGENDVVLHVYQGEFATLGYNGPLDPGGIEVTPTPPVVPYDPMEGAGVEETIFSLPYTKTLYKGQIVIIRDGKWYNLQGVRVL